MTARRKEQAIAELVGLLATAGKISDTEPVLQAVLERERLATTGIGEGLAIPHGKSGCCPVPVMAVGRAIPPLDFAGVDGKPVELILLLVSPPEQSETHIRTLGDVSRLWLNTTLRRNLLAADSAEALSNLIRQHPS